MKLYITHFRRSYNTNNVKSDIVNSEAFFIDRHVYFSYETGKNYLHYYVISITPVYFLGSSDFRKNYKIGSIIELDYKRSENHNMLSFEQFIGISGLHNYSYGGKKFNISFTEELAKVIKEGLRKAHKKFSYDNY